MPTFRLVRLQAFQSDSVAKVYRLHSVSAAAKEEAGRGTQCAAQRGSGFTYHGG